MIRKSSAEAAGATRAAPAAAVAAPPHQAPAPAKPSRAERKALEERKRQDERVRKQQEKEAARRRDEERERAEARRIELEKEEERRRKDEAKETRKRERKHRRHSKRVNKRAAELDLRNGERVSVSIEGWSRFRRATLVVTNYRVALITRVPPQVRWIPLEEVAGVHHAWRGAHSLVVTSSVEVLTLQKSKRQMLASFEQLLSAEVEEAKRPGATERHHGDITQEWCDLATQVWDSRARRLHLWIRKHPLVTVGTFAFCVVGAFLLTTVLTSLFSPYR